jgi:hypothetical protein
MSRRPSGSATHAEDLREARKAHWLGAFGVEKSRKYFIRNSSTAGCSVLRSAEWTTVWSRPSSINIAASPQNVASKDGLGHPTIYQAHFWLSKVGSNSGVVFEHGAGDVEEPVAYGAESAGMAATASFQNKIFGFALLVAPPGGVRQVVNCVPQPWIAGEGIVTFGLPAFGSADANSPPCCFASAGTMSMQEPKIACGGVLRSQIVRDESLRQEAIFLQKLAHQF